MTEKTKRQKTDFAKQCMVEQLDDMLASGEITQEAHDRNVAKIMAA